MFFIWGSGGGKSDEGTIGTCNCEVCNNEAPFNATIHYRYFHFWYLFSFLTSRKYIYECSHCQNGYYVEAAEFKKNFQKNHIPFIRKFGWLVCIGIIAILIAIGSMSASQHNNQTQSYISAPAVNDLYLVDFAKVENSGYNNTKHAYGVMRLTEITAEGKYYFVISSHSYSKKRGAEKMVKTPASIEFDKETGITFTDQQLHSLKDSRIIFDIIR